MGYSRRVETTDQNKNLKLRTHYYKTDGKKAIAELEALVKKYNYELVNLNLEYKELLIRNKKVDIIVSVVEVSPIEVAIDFNITRKPYDLFGFPLPDFKVCEKYVETFYNYLDSKLTVKKVGGMR